MTLCKHLLQSFALIAFLLFSDISAAVAQTTYEYDKLGRLKVVEYDEGETTEYVYDAAGNRQTVETTLTEPLVSVSDATVLENGQLVFTVSRTQNTVDPFSVAYASSDGTATSGSDYTAVSDTLNFGLNEPSKTITIQTLDDGIFEDTETLTVTLSSPTDGAVIVDGEGLGSITDDESPPAFSISGSSVNEGAAVTFTIELSRPSSSQHDISYATSVGTANSSDFTAGSDTLNFLPGETVKTVDVATTSDSNFENNESFTMALSNATGGATISVSSGVGAINNNDPAPVFSIVNASAVNEGQALSFKVTKSGSTDLTHTISFATANGSAESSDYTASSDSIEFLTSDDEKWVTIGTAADSIYELSETVVVNLSNPTNGASALYTQGVGTINNTSPAPSFSINSNSSGEGDPIVFTITKSGDSELTHAVTYATANGTAFAGSDYSASSNTITFYPATTPQPITITTVENTYYEENETFYVNLSNATNGASISVPQGVGTILNDDPYVEYVRDPYGGLFPGYTQTLTYNWRIGWGWGTWSGSTLIHHVVTEELDEPDGYCYTWVNPISGYSWTGNGCEMRVD